MISASAVKKGRTMMRELNFWPPGPQVSGLKTLENMFFRHFMLTIWFRSLNVLVVTGCIFNLRYSYNLYLTSDRHHVR